MTAASIPDARLLTLIRAATAYLEHLRGTLSPYDDERLTPEREPRPDAPATAEELAAQDALLALLAEHHRRSPGQKSLPRTRRAPRLRTGK